MDIKQQLGDRIRMGKDRDAGGRFVSSNPQKVLPTPPAIKQMSNTLRSATHKAMGKGQK